MVPWAIQYMELMRFNRLEGDSLIQTAPWEGVDLSGYYCFNRLEGDSLIQTYV